MRIGDFHQLHLCRHTSKVMIMELRRITTRESAAPCQELSNEYMEWLAERLSDSFGIVLPEAEIEELHAELRAQADLLFRDPGRLYLGYVESEPVSLGLLKPVGDGEGELKRMFVRPEYRGRGFGSTMLHRLIDDARELGYERLRLETFPFMESAVALYRKNGFQDAPAFEGFEGASHGVGDVEMFMTLDLA